MLDEESLNINTKIQFLSYLNYLNQLLSSSLIQFRVTGTMASTSAITGRQLGSTLGRSSVCHRSVCIQDIRIKPLIKNRPTVLKTCDNPD